MKTTPLQDATAAQNMWRLRMFLFHLSLVAAPLVICYISSILPSMPLGMCIFRDIVGIDCPACGITRSVNATFHLHFHDAFSFNPTGPIVAFLALALSIYFLTAVVVGNRIQIEWRKEVQAYSYIDWGLAILLIAGWVVKTAMN